MSTSVVNVLFAVEAIIVALILIAALVLLIVKRRRLAVAGVGVLILGQLFTVAWPLVISFVPMDLSTDGYLLMNLGFNTVSSILFLIGLGLIIAELVVKRPAGGLQGQP